MDRAKFFEVYELTNRGCFNLYEMNAKYKYMARKYKKCIAIMESEDG